MDTQLQNWLASSQDASKVSLRVMGAIVSSSSLIIYFAMQFLHLTLSAGDVGTLATGIGIIAGAITLVVGVIRAVVIKVGTVR